MSKHADITLHFYQGDHLHCSVGATTSRTLLRNQNQSLAEQQHQAGNASAKTLATDAQGSVLRAHAGMQTKSLSYTAYGHSPNEDVLSSLAGFNGEARVSQTGCYLLGNGYRAYNLVLRRFNLPESLIPLGDECSIEAGHHNANLLVADTEGTVMNAQQDREAPPLHYTTHGHSKTDYLPLTKLAFNGQQRDLHTGWYLLGNGYRAYNPVLMRFHSSDAESPFEIGGLNSYAYCQGDPINLSDPSGRAPVNALRSLNPARNPKQPRNRAQARRLAARASQVAMAAEDEIPEMRWRIGQARTEMETTTDPQNIRDLLAIIADQEQEIIEAQSQARAFRLIARNFKTMGIKIPGHEENLIPTTSARITSQSSRSMTHLPPSLETQRIRQITIRPASVS